MNDHLGWLNVYKPINISSFGDFGIRSKVGYDTMTILDAAPTISMGFEMNIPRLNKKNIM